MKIKVKPRDTEHIYQVGHVIRRENGETVMVCRSGENKYYSAIDLVNCKELYGCHWTHIEGLGDDLYRPGDRLIIDPVLVEGGQSYGGN